MIYLRRQKDLTRIVKYLTKCISKKRKLHGILEKLEAIHKKEPVYIGTDGEKEVRIVIGNQITYTRCHPKDTFDLARGVTICICNILNKKSKELNSDDVIRLLTNGVSDEYSRLPPLSFPSGGIVSPAKEESKSPVVIGESVISDKNNLNKMGSLAKCYGEYLMPKDMKIVEAIDKVLDKHLPKTGMEKLKTDLNIDLYDVVYKYKTDFEWEMVQKKTKINEVRIMLQKILDEE